jgi:hypothetical protein
MKEIWKDVVGYENLYKISNLGRVLSVKRKVWNGFAFVEKKEKIMKQNYSHKGYLTLGLRKNGKGKGHQVHRLVAQAFIDNPLNKKTVNHKNGIKDDNNLKNLEWMTVKENVRHSWKNKLCTRKKGELNCQSKLKEVEVLNIKKLLNNMTQVEIAKIYNVHPSTIHLIKKGKNWKHLKESDN